MARPGRPIGQPAEVFVDAARDLIEDEGRSAFSLRAVAQRAGTSTTAIYTHFGSADALLDAVAGAYLDGAEYPGPTGDAIADLKAFVMADFARALEHPRLAALVLERAPATPALTRALQHLGDLLRAEGHDHATVATTLSTLGLHSLGAFTTLTSRRRADALRRFEADVDLILAGVASCRPR